MSLFSSSFIKAKWNEVDADSLWMKNEVTMHVYCPLILYRTVIHPWQYTTPTELSAMWSCSSMTKPWQIVSMRWSWTVNQLRHTSSWVSVTWSWRTTMRPLGTYRKVRKNSRMMVKMLLVHCTNLLVQFLIHVKVNLLRSVRPQRVGSSSLRHSICLHELLSV